MVQRVIDAQLRVMRKQLELVRSVQADADGVRPVAPSVTLPVVIDVVSGDPDTLGTVPVAADTPIARRVPLTDAQRDVWIVCQLGHEASAAYDLSTTLELRGQLDTEALRTAIGRLTERHASLRATIDPSGDHMLIPDHISVDLPIVDLSGFPMAERSEQVAAYVDAQMTYPYDLVNGPLFRATLLRNGEDDHLLVLSAHHLITDGWSLGVMQRDLGALYTAVVRDRAPDLGPATRFEDFVAWHADQSADAAPYWLELYDRPPVQLDLPTDGVRPPVRTFDYGTHRAVIGEELLPSLRELAVANGVTPFVVLLAAWQLLLHRLSGQAEFASGVFVSGQASMGARSLVGLCTNLLPLRAEMEPHELLSDHLARLQRSTFDAFDNQHYALGDLASALQLARDASRPTMVSTVITLETPTHGIDYAGLRAIETVHGRRRYGSFDLEAYLTETQADLIVDFKYATALFDPATIERWVGHYLHLLRQMATRADGPLGGLRLLDDVERADLLVRWNHTDAPVPDTTTPRLVEVQAARHPDRVAIEASGGSLTYGELDTRANRLAAYLRSLGVGPDKLVGVHVERSPEMVVALLAVHKAGGAYVPLDPLFPTERLAMIVEDAGLQVLLTDGPAGEGIMAPGVTLVRLDRDHARIEALDPTDLGIAVAPSDLAYVIYTSGSTGRPKGVELPHVALTNLLEAMRREPGLDADDKLLAVTTMSFDISALELFLPLIVGATVVLADAQEAVDAIWLRERLGRGDISVMQATPATWQLLLDAAWPGTAGLKALCGGEALSEDLAAGLRTRVASLWNMYGPTETTIWSSVSDVTSAGAPISIGRPIANTQFHVLDGALEPQPVGIPGELYIGGIGLARGYRNRPDLTSERFIDHRFDDAPARRLYKTGDVVRQYPDGHIEYIGRSDFQVKIRGFRIELGEIESVLARHPDVKECAVMARDGRNGTKQLVAYVVPASERTANVSELRAHLRETLPEYMVPALFMVLDAFPLTANKKVDRARLPDPDGQRPDLETEHVEPRTATEATLVRIWQELLGVDRVGIEDNFFDLGGDSLLALRSIMRANRSGMSLAPVSIFRHQTIAELAEAADAAGVANADGAVEAVGPTPLTPAELRFLTERRTPDPHQWNISTLVEVDRPSPSALRSAVAAVLRHHDALRFRLWREGDVWRQEIVAATDEVPFETHDLTSLTPAERSAAIESACSMLQSSFDLATPPMLRVAHFVCGPGEPDRLFVTIHHFAIDGLTWSVFWEDLAQAYRQAAEGEPIALPAKTTPFRVWALQLEQLAQTPRVVDTAERWKRLPWHEVAPLPLDHQQGHNTNASATAVELELGAEETLRLLDSHQRPEHLILAALAGRLSAWTGSQGVLVDVLSHGRDAAFEDVNLSRTVGFTLSYNPLVLRHDAWGPTLDVLDDVGRQIRETPEGFSFELLRFLTPDASLRQELTRLPRADVLFNYAGIGEDTADALWRRASERTGAEESPRGLRQYPLAVRATLSPNLRLRFVYSTELHERATIEAMAAEVATAIRGLLGELDAMRRPLAWGGPARREQVISR
jgi:amino acid adenylation domain-containing protein/non-ribosomal peptide synthase protein (TIGR01720 family)